MSMHSWGRGIFLFIFLLILVIGIGSQGHTLQQDTLALHNPENLTLSSITNPFTGNFIVLITFDDIPDSIGTAINIPNLNSWSVYTPESLLSTPITFGSYHGDVDRTIRFRAWSGGVMGDSLSIILQYEIVGEEVWSNFLDVGSSNYMPGDTIICNFISSATGDTMDLGLRLKLTEGIVDSNGVFLVGCEDFEGYHIWRGVIDGSGNIRHIENIGEVSKEEANARSLCDSIYFYGMVPNLRNTGTYFFEPVDQCFSRGRISRLDIPLNGNQLFWVDYNAFHGFTYAYSVTTFDRGYVVSSSSQGLVKTTSFVHCVADTIESPEPCQNMFSDISIDVEAQDDLRKIYVVPNPYRTGGSMYIAPNYHNFADNMIRIVNVPEDCKLGIYTPAGDLVWETEHHSKSGDIVWNTRNDSGQEVASGVYVYKIEDSKGGSVYGKIVIIR